MSFGFTAMGSLEEVLAQVIEADVHGDPAGEEMKQLLRSCLRMPPVIVHGQKPVFCVRAGGSGTKDTMPEFSLDVSYSWVPDVRESTRQDVREMLGRDNNDGRNTRALSQAQ